MAKVTYNDFTLDVEPGDTLLDAFLDIGEDIPHACKAGACQSCLMQATEGTPPSGAQTRLKGTQQAQGYFLACQCYPDQDLCISLPGGVSTFEGTVDDVKKESSNVLRLWLHSDIDYKPGQFVNLVRNDGLTRSYSIASVPSLDNRLEFHIRILPDGKFSGWAGNDMKSGETFEIQGPFGDCFYSGGNKEQPLLLAGTGTGLAPLYGIARDALQQGHCAPIQLFTGARNIESLYLLEELRALAEEFPQFSYIPVVLEAEDGHTIDDLEVGDLNEVIKAQQPKLDGYSVFLCGSEQRVNSLRKQVFMAGVSMKEIYFDLFTPAEA